MTVEGLGSVQNGLHPVQERIAKSHGTQCGFCTPGFVMSMYSLLRNNPNPTEHDLQLAFQGNSTAIFLKKYMRYFCVYK